MGNGKESGETGWPAAYLIAENAIAGEWGRLSLFGKGYVILFSRNCLVSSRERGKKGRRNKKVARKLNRRLDSEESRDARAALPQELLK